MDVILITLRDISSAFFSLLTYAVIGRALLSWFQPDPNHQLVRLLLRVTDPILLPIQRVIPSFGGLDLSPIAAIFLLQGAQSVVGSVLTKIAYSMG